MRSLVASLVLLLLPASAAAGQASTGRPAPTPLPSIGLPLPTIGLPLPTLGLPLPPLGSEKAPVVDAVPSRDPRGDGVNRRTHVRERHPVQTTVIFAAPYAWIDPSPAPFGSTPQSTPETLPAEPTTGWLRLEMDPARAVQLFVDEEYVGTVEDTRGELELAAGTRRLEMRAAGYKSLVVNVKVIGGRTITYRDTLDPIAVDSPSRSASSDRSHSSPASGGTPKPKQTFYFIPGCYLGNVPPSEVKLPDGCDLTKLVTRTP